MSASFSMDPNWQENVLRAIDDDLRRRASDLQRGMDRLRPTYVGKPPAEIKPAVRQAWKRATDGQITDPELSAYADAISTGQPIKIQYKGVK